MNKQTRWSDLAATMLSVDGIDNRLTPGQMHMLVTTALDGQEPLAVAAELVGLSLNPKSKVEMSETEAAKLLCQIHDRIYQAEEREKKRKPADADQFELTFAWAVERENA